MLLLPLSPKSQPLEAYMDHSVFQQSNGKPFLEIYLQIPANTLELKETPEQDFKGKASIKLELLDEEQSKPVAKRTYELSTPDLQDSSKADFYLTDLQRLRLPRQGQYKLYLTIADVNAGNYQVNVSKDIPIFIPEKQTSISGLQLIDTLWFSEHQTKFTKSNYEFLPNASHIIGKNQQTLHCYAEVYNPSNNLSRKDSVQIRLEVRPSKSGEPQHSINYKRPAKKRISIIGRVQTKNLEPGNHFITLKVLDNQDKFLAIKQTKILKAGSKKADQKKTMDTTALRNLTRSYESDTLVQYINWLDPIADLEEGKSIKALFAGDTVKKELDTFFIAFWERRDSVYPNKAWQKYKAEVKQANEHFSSPLYEGYETDRGRVYLQYGPPNTIYRSRDDPNYRPYRIWHYFSTKRQANVKFVFFSQSFLEEDFVLLHSNALREIQNPNWQKRLKRNVGHQDDFGNKPEFDYIK